jgi:hypothetical protein
MQRPLIHSPSSLSEAARIKGRAVREDRQGQEGGEDGQPKRGKAPFKRNHGSASALTATRQIQCLLHIVLSFVNISAVQLLAVTAYAEAQFCLIFSSTFQPLTLSWLGCVFVFPEPFDNSNS